MTADRLLPPPAPSPGGRRRRLFASAGVACLVAALGGGVATDAAQAALDPGFSITAAGPAVSGLSSPDEIAALMLGPGVSLAGPATINGTATPPDPGSPLPSFGRFQGGLADVGIDEGLIIAANARAESFLSSFTAPTGSPGRGDAELANVAYAAGVCWYGPATCIFNATSVEFSVVPTARYLKFEYALAITEVGSWSAGSWLGAVSSYPDGFALFVGGRQITDNCAVVPGTSDYLTMTSAGIVAPLGGDGLGPPNRAEALSRLEARLADPDRPPTTPNGFAYLTQQDSNWAVKFLTVPITCVADVGDQLAAGSPAEVKIVVADANDSNVPPAVFLKGGSVRFEVAPEPSAAVPAADATPPAQPVPAPSTPPVSPPAPGPAPAPAVADALRPATAGVAADGRLRVATPITLNAAGRYTFIFTTADGRRATWEPGSRLGTRALGGRYSAPVLRVGAPGRRLVIISRFAKDAGLSDLRLRVVLKRPDGTVADATLPGARVVRR